MNCIHCESKHVVKNGSTTLQTGQVLQKYLCNDCGRRFNERTGTPMSRLRTRVEIVEAAINARGEGLGVRATGRVVKKSPSQIIAWEQRLSKHLEKYSPPAPAGGGITVEGDELYTRVNENLPPRNV
jgi:transposase-like protein